MIGKSAPPELSICRLGVLPTNFYIRSKGEHGLTLHLNAEVLAVVRAPEEKRVRVCVCLIHAARYLAEREAWKLRAADEQRAGAVSLAQAYGSMWIDAQRDYDRAIDLAMGRLEAKRRRHGGV